MFGLTFKGIGNGCSQFNSFGAYGHFRPLVGNIGVDRLQCNVWLDHVESNVGTSDNTSHICDIQLSSSKYKREEAK